MNKSGSVEKFWRDFCAENPDVNPNESYQVWFFGNSPKMARELAELVISGKKHATASLAEFNEKHPEVAPIDAGFSVVTLEDWREGHQRYFTKEAAEFDLEFNEKSLVCCERFKLLYPHK
jgi:uncharacterized protein YhfF